MTLVKVRYKGLSDVREMSPKDLKKINIKVDKAVTWNRANLWTVVMQDVPDTMLQMFKDDGAFTVSEVDDKGAEGRPVVEATVQDDTAPVVVNATTGQKSVKGSGS